MNALERAVIEAARDFQNAESDARLIGAVMALEEHERALTAAGLIEIPWAQVAEGDRVQGKSGALYPVIATRRQWKMGKATGKFVITMDLGLIGQELREIIRPSESQPKAVVKRGDSGKAVDMFVSVFESGKI